MDWSIVGAMAEAVGAVAVVISLVYLASQIRHNTESVRLQTFQTIIDRTAAMNSRTSSEYVAGVLARGRESYLGLSDAERLTFDYCMHERLLAHESALALGHLLKPSIRDVVHENLHGYFRYAGVREWWAHEEREAIAQDFEDEVERLIGTRTGANDTRIAGLG